MKSIFKAFPVILSGLGFLSNGLAEPVSVYQQRTAPVESRVDDLLSRMTPKEKIAQITSRYMNVPPPANESSDDAMAERYPAGFGTIATPQLGIEAEVALRNQIRRVLKERTRLGIPAFFHDELAHGLMKPEATSFPAPIGLACSWDEALIEKIYDTAAREARARGANQALTPVVDVILDPRWGRTDEMLGEDPYLNGRLGTAMVKGLQGGATGEIDGQHVMATLKHFAGHGASLGGLNASPANIGPHEFRETHVAPFAAVIRAAQPASIMPSYAEVDGIPPHGNRALLTDLARGELGFTGLFVSDYGGIAQLNSKHRVVASRAEAGRLALEAGVQMELPWPEAFSRLEPLLADDPALAALVDDAVRAVLRWKFKLGLFDEPAELDAKAAGVLAGQPAARELALQAARESIVLLKNDGGLLPLAVERYRRIAVIGPNADVARLGGYSGQPKATVSLLAGLRERVGDKVEIMHAEGCRITKGDLKQSYPNVHTSNAEWSDPAEDQRLIAEAVEVATKNDLVVLALGENEVISREAVLPTRRGDRPSLDLFGAQIELTRAVLATGKPVVLFLSNGRPITLGNLAERVPAIIEGWYAGQETGRAAAEILFGDVNPSGKLTISFPRSVGHIPANYRMKPSHGQFTYVFDSHAAAFPFGFGLSYTTFGYSNLRVNKAQIARDEEVQVSVDVTNTGKRAGVEIAQLYLRDEVSTVTRPVMELRGFQRVLLQPGETRTLTFGLQPDDLSFYNRELKRVVESGWFTVMVGGSSAATIKERFELK